LRRDWGFPRGEARFGIDSVFSPEPPVFPQADGFVCEGRNDLPAEAAASGETLRLNCDWGLGSATFVTGTFGFAAAGLVVRRLVESAVPVRASEGS
jgi:tRNA A37 threonylcarbamoyladenosine dehydratase